MSSYLNFYLVPKKTKKRYKGDKAEVVNISEGIPLSFLSYSRASEVYQAYNDTLNPAYSIEEKKYTELTTENADMVCRECTKNIKDTERRLNVTYKMLREKYDGELYADIQSTEEYLHNMKDTLEELHHIRNWVYEINEGYTDFEKVLINIC